MKSQKKSSEENIHLSSLLPSNVLSELDSNQNFPRNNNEKEINVSKYFLIYFLSLYSLCQIIQIKAKEKIFSLIKLILIQ